MNALFKSSPLLRAGVVTSLGLVAASLFSPAHAHHPFGMGDSTNLSALQGLLSGIGHPLLGPDHLLFLLAVLPTSNSGHCKGTEGQSDGAAQQQTVCPIAVNSSICNVSFLVSVGISH